MNTICTSSRVAAHDLESDALGGDLQIAERRSHSDCLMLFKQKQAAYEPQILSTNHCVHGATANEQSTNHCVHGATANEQEPDTLRSSMHCQQRVPQEAATAEHAGGAPVCASAFTACGAEHMSAGAHEKVSDDSRSASQGARSSTATDHEVKLCKGPETESTVLQDASWAQVVPKDQGIAWLQAAKAGDVAALEQLLKSNVALLAYRGQGTHFGFGGMIPYIFKQKIVHNDLW
jgi:hypothetical protein